VGGGGNCAVDTEVSKQSNVGRNETMVGSSKVVVGHSGVQRGAKDRRDRAGTAFQKGARFGRPCDIRSQWRPHVGLRRSDKCFSKRIR